MSLSPFDHFMNAVGGLSTTSGLAVFALIVICLGVHEAAHAWTANLCGDSTAKDQGRITLNPIAHIDPFMTILLPAVLFFSTGMIFGGAKPCPVVPGKLRHPARDMMFVSIAGPLSNFLLGVLFLTLWKLTAQVDLYEDPVLPYMLLATAGFNVVLAIFNMLPIPPLDGSRVMAFLLPDRLRRPYVRLGSIGILILLGLMWFRGVEFWNLIRSAFNPVMRAADKLTFGDWSRFL